MTKYDFRNYIPMKDEVEQLKDQILTLREQLIAPKNQVITGMPHGGNANKDKMAEVISRIDELERKYIVKYTALLNECERIEKAIEPLESKERMLMRYKYLQGMKWEDVALEMNYSVENIYKLHGRILLKLKRVQ